MSREIRQWSGKYRPKTLKQILGNEDAKQEAAQVIARRDEHAIGIFGPTGCSKTTLARIIANALTSEPSDIEKTNISDKRGLDDIRAIAAKTGFLPKGETKVFLLEECHALLGQAQSALLDELEEPKHDRVVFILTTDRPHMLSEPLMNRLYKIYVAPPPLEDLAKLLYRIIEREEVLTSLSDKNKRRVALEVAKAADRVPREALQLLKSVVNKSGNFDSFRDLVIHGIRNRVDTSVDKTALQVIGAIYSRQLDVDKRASYLLNQLVDKDLWALVMRLLYVHNALLNAAGGVTSGQAHYFKRDLAGVEGVPDLRRASYVGARLSRMKNELATVNSSIDQYLVPALVEILYDTHERWPKDS